MRGSQQLSTIMFSLGAMGAALIAETLEAAAEASSVQPAQSPSSSRSRGKGKNKRQRQTTSPGWIPTFRAQSSSATQSKRQQQSRGRGDSRGRQYLVSTIVTSPEEAETAQELLRQAGGVPFMKRIS